MSGNDHHFTYNPISNDDRDLLLSNGYVPGEMTPEEMHEVVRDLKAASEGDETPLDIGDERDSG